MPSVKNISDDLRDLVKLQKAVASSFTAAKQNVRTQQAMAKEEMATAVRLLVPADDSAIYDELSQAARAANDDTDFAAKVRDWTKQDEANLQERAKLEGQWGDSTAIAKREVVAYENKTAYENAVAKLETTIADFEDTLTAIRAHNAKYPKFAISETGETTNVKKAGLGSLIAYKTGMKSGGAYSAKLVLEAYAEEHEIDFFEQAARVDNLRVNLLPSLQQKLMRAAQELDAVSQAARRMGELERTFRGAEGIARQIRDTILVSLELGSTAFAILPKMNNTHANEAVVSRLKVKALQEIKEKLDVPADEAKKTLGDLVAPAETLQHFSQKIANAAVLFDSAALERSVSDAAEASRNIMRKTNTAIRNIADYTAALDATEADIKADLMALTQVDIESNALSIDLDEFCSKVEEIADDYDLAQRSVKITVDPARKGANARRDIKQAFAAAAQIENRDPQMNADASIDVNNLRDWATAASSTAGEADGQAQPEEKKAPAPDLAPR